MVGGVNLSCKFRAKQRCSTSLSNSPLAAQTFLNRLLPTPASRHRSTRQCRQSSVNENRSNTGDPFHPKVRSFVHLLSSTFASEFKPPLGSSSAHKVSRSAICQSSFLRSDRHATCPQVVIRSNVKARLLEMARLPNDGQASDGAEASGRRMASLEEEPACDYWDRVPRWLIFLTAGRFESLPHSYRAIVGIRRSNQRRRFFFSQEGHRSLVTFAPWWPKKSFCFALRSPESRTFRHVAS